MEWSRSDMCLTVTCGEWAFRICANRNVNSLEFLNHFLNMKQEKKKTNGQICGSSVINRKLSDGNFHDVQIFTEIFRIINLMCIIWQMIYIQTRNTNFTTFTKRNHFNWKKKTKQLKKKTIIISSHSLARAVSG